MGLSRRELVSTACVWTAAVLLLAAAPSEQQNAGSSDSFVTTLTQANFDQHIPSRGAGVFVNFYMPWCKYSKKLTLDYELLGHAFQRVRDVTVSRVNCEQDKPLCERFEVKGYPTLVWFPRGSTEGVDYKGGRTSQEMIKFVNEQANIKAKPKRRPNQIKALTAANFKAVVEDEETDAVVQFLVPGDEVCQHFETEYDMLATALAAETHITFWTLDASVFPDIARREGAKTFPLVKLFRRRRRGSKAYTGKYTAVSLLPWMNEHTDASRMLSGVANSTVGRLPILDALVDRLARSPPAAWQGQTQEALGEVLKLEGRERLYGDMYLEALGDITSDGGFELMTAKRLEINERMVLEKDPAVRSELHAQRNVIAAVQGKAERLGMLGLLKERQEKELRQQEQEERRQAQELEAVNKQAGGDGSKVAGGEKDEQVERRSVPRPPKKIKRGSKADKGAAAKKDEL